MNDQWQKNEERADIVWNILARCAELGGRRKMEEIEEIVVHLQNALISSIDLGVFEMIARTPVDLMDSAGDELDIYVLYIRDPHAAYLAGLNGPGVKVQFELPGYGYSGLPIEDVLQMLRAM